MSIVDIRKLHRVYELLSKSYPHYFYVIGSMPLWTGCGLENNPPESIRIINNAANKFYKLVITENV